jgi:regulatory protein
MDQEIYRTLLKKAGALLARRPYTRGKLRDKLLAITGESAVEPVLDRLEQLNLLNDADYAYNFALCRIQRNGWGPAKVQRSLLHRQVGQTTIENALERIRGETGSDSALADYVQKYYRTRGVPANPKEIRKLITHLLQRGFNEESILSELRQTIDGAIWQRIETGE